jgi:hypothetical protein
VPGGSFDHKPDRRSAVSAPRLPQRRASPAHRMPRGIATFASAPYAATPHSGSVRHRHG